MNALRRSLAPALFSLAAICAGCMPAPVFAHGHKSRKAAQLILSFDEPAWLLFGSNVGFGGEATIGPANGFISPPNSLTLAANNTDPHGPLAVLHFDTVGFTMNAGTSYHMGLWVNADAAVEGTPLRIATENGVFGGDGFLQGTYFSIYKHQVSAGWQFVDLGTFLNSVGPPSAMRIALQLANLAPATETGNVSGQWVIDGIGLVEQEQEDDEMLTRRKAVSDTFVARARTVTIANGYSVSVGDVVDEDVSERSAGAFPQVGIIAFQDEMEAVALTREQLHLAVEIGVRCKDGTGLSPAKWQCDEVHAALEKALVFGQGSASNWTGLNWVQMIQRTHGKVDRVTSEVARGFAFDRRVYLVKYQQDRGKPFAP